MQKGLFYILFLLLIFSPNISFSNPAAEEKLAQKILSALVKTTASDVQEGRIILYPWRRELERATSMVLERESRGVNKALLEAVQEKLSTPTRALRYVEEKKLQTVLRSISLEWESALRAFEVTHTTIARGTVVLQEELHALEALPGAHQNLKRYYEAEIDRLSLEVLSLPKKVPQKDIEAAVLNLRKNVGSDRELLEISEMLNRGVKEMEQVYLPSASYTTEEVLLYIQKLKSLSEKLGNYIFTRAVRQIPHTLRGDYYLAQIRYAPLTYKKRALNLLFFNFDSEGTFITKEVMREIFQHSELSEYAIYFFKEQGAMPRKVLQALEELNILKNRFFPGEKAYEAYFEGMVNLASHWEVGKLESVAVAHLLPMTERVGAVRAMGRIYSNETFTGLRNILFHSDVREPELIEVVLEELVSSVRSENIQRSKTVRMILEAMVLKSENVSTRMAAARGIGKLLRGDGNVFTKKHFLDLLEEISEPLVKAELLLAMSKFEPRQWFSNRLAIYLHHPALEVRIAAAQCTLNTHSDLALYTFANAVSAPTGAIHERFRVIALEQAYEKFFDFSALKAGLLDLARTSPSIQVRLAALKVLSKSKSSEAVSLLLELSGTGEVTGSLQIKVIEILLTHTDEPAILSLVLQRMIYLCEHARGASSFLEKFSNQHILLERFYLLKGDATTLGLLRTYQSTENKTLKLFIEEILQIVNK
ncbi:MAG: hypothetical protein A3B70_05295 [Deltaproteobacteria bacterium RIFCSPHIGHO2_02_FULL_40_11]|nr:MAG: hypothetical protein A3B70_05295 [Deltaproteobacteria bacterium RIFCSPHIGHO2_02_FULL_40_11]